MEIKSTLLNSEDFKYVKDSLINISEIDGKEKFRVKVLEYIDDTSSNSEDMFFYDMLEFVRFLPPTDEAVAYTTPEHLIFLNCPGKIGESVRHWDFIYDHECLHQLWDTFAVGDKITKELGQCDHRLLNIASDCVINDYLSFYRKKDHPDDLITPEYLKEAYDVDYNRKVDTQYTLYLKLLEKIEQVKKDKHYQEGDGQGQGQGQGQDGQGQGKPGQGSDQDGQGQSKGQGGHSQGQSGQGQGQDGQGQDGKDGQGQGQGKDGKDGQGQGQGQGQGKDGQGQGQGQGQGKDGKDGQGQDGKDGQGQGKDGQGQNNSKGHGDEKGTLDITNMSQKELDELKNRAKDIIDQYKSKISGDLGEFVNKCKKSHELKKSGLAVNTNKGANGWNQKLNTSVNAFVKKKVWEKKKQFKPTYSRVKRGSGFVKYGEQIQKGKKIIDKKFTINVAFYVDKSGSMDGDLIENVFKAVYIIAEGLKQKYKSERVVDEVAFKIYAFDTEMEEIKYGSKARASGGTMPFHEIIKFIGDNTDSFLINVIITDADFDVNANEVKKFIKNVDGMLEFITNNDNQEMKELAKEYPTQLNYILADNTFKLT